MLHMYSIKGSNSSTVLAKHLLQLFLLNTLAVTYSKHLPGTCSLNLSSLFIYMPLEQT